MQSTNNQGTSAYDSVAEVRRVEGDTAWVHIAGGVDETPVKLTIAAKAGDVVQVRVGGGRAWITGNASAPPTDDKTAIAAKGLANLAGSQANVAQTTAINAQVMAQTAQTAAESAVADAARAQAAADSAVTDAARANTAANNAQADATKASEAAADAGRNASLAQSAAEAAGGKVDNLSKYFYHDDQGAHVISEKHRMDLTGESTTITEISTGNVISQFGKNILLGAGLLNSKMELTDRALSFRSWTEFFKVASQRSEDDEKHRAIVYKTFAGDGERTDFRISTMKYDIQSVTVDGESAAYTEDAYGYIILNSAPKSGTAVKFTLRAKNMDDAEYMTFGFRDDKSNLGATSVAIGNGNSVQGDNAIAIGALLDAASDNQFVIGKSNIRDDKKQYAFILGNGGTTGKAKSNALTVDWAGNLWTAGGITGPNGDPYLTDADLSSILAAGIPTNICAGDDNPTGERQVHVKSTAGDMYMFSQGPGGTGRMGLYIKGKGSFVFYDAVNKRVESVFPWFLRLYSANEHNDAAYPVTTSANNTGLVSKLICEKTNHLKIEARWGASSWKQVDFTLSTSDARLKENIADCTVEALPIINAIQMREFDWRETGEHQTIGMVADELEQIDPALASGGGTDPETGAPIYKSVDTYYLIGYLVKAVQELSAKVDALGIKLTEDNKWN